MAPTAIYAILKQKPYNFTTNTLKPCLSTQASSLSGFVISKTHISDQKPHGRQLNAKVCRHESAIFRILPSFLLGPRCSTTISQKRFKYSLSFSRKLILIKTWGSTSTQCLHSFKFTLVNKSHSQHSVVAVRCERRHFLILYACAHEVSFPGQIPHSLVWERH